MADYSQWDLYVSKFRGKSPNIAKAFDEAKKHSIRQDEELTALAAAGTSPGGSRQSWTNGWGNFSSPSGLPGATWRPYSDASWINTPLPPSPTLVSNSTAMVARVLNTGSFKSFRPNSALANDYQHPYYFSTGSDPLYTVNSTRSAGLDGVQVRIPDQAQPSGGTDAHLTICDQTSGYIYDFWECAAIPVGGGTFNCGLAGKSLVSSYGGHHPTGANVDYQGYANAGGNGNLAGIIRFPELEAGRIDHALFLVAGLTDGTQVYPARSYGSTAGLPDSPPTGQWFYLDMTWAEIDALTLVAGWQKTIFKALSKYGGWIGDQSTSMSFQLQCEGVSTWNDTTNPWVAWCTAQRLLPNHHIDLSGGVFYPDWYIASEIDWYTKLKAVHPDVILG